MRPAEAIDTTGASTVAIDILPSEHTRRVDGEVLMVLKAVGEVVGVVPDEVFLVGTVFHILHDEVEWLHLYFVECDVVAELILSGEDIFLCVSLRLFLAGIHSFYAIVVAALVEAAPIAVGEREGLCLVGQFLPFRLIGGIHGVEAVYIVAYALLHTSVHTFCKFRFAYFSLCRFGLQL